MNWRRHRKTWVAPFAAMAEECSLGIDVATAFQEIAVYLRDVRRRTQGESARRITHFLGFSGCQTISGSERRQG